MKRIKLVVIFAVVLVTVFSAFVYFNPISLGDVTKGHSVDTVALVQRKFVEDIIEYESFTYDIEEYSILEADLFSILEKYNYSRTLFYFQNANEEPNKNTIDIWFDSLDGSGISISSSGVCKINGNIVTVYEAEKLVDELMSFFAEHEDLKEEL